MEQNLIKAMKRRVLRHFLSCFGGVVVAIVGTMIVGALVPTTGGPAPRWSHVVGGLMFFIIPLAAIVSTFVNLRCPSCEKWIPLQVSANFSAFGPLARKTCFYCNAPIFVPQPDSRAEGLRRMKPFIYVIVGVIVAAAVVGMATALLMQHR